MPGVFAVSVDGRFASGQARVHSGAAADEQPVGVDKDVGVPVRLDALLLKDVIDDGFPQIILQPSAIRPTGRWLAALAGDDGDAMDAIGPAIAVFDPDLRLPVGGEVG